MTFHLVEMGLRQKYVYKPLETLLPKSLCKHYLGNHEIVVLYNAKHGPSRGSIH